MVIVSKRYGPDATLMSYPVGDVRPLADSVLSRAAVGYGSSHRGNRFLGSMLANGIVDSIQRYFERGSLRQWNVP